MNHAYRPVFNHALNAWVAAPETAKGRGKTKAIVAAAVLLSAAAFSAHALSPNGTITAGAGEITQSGSTTTITQTSQNLAINWPSFNLGPGETAHFVQPNAAAIALNRILGTEGSTILGTLKANGQVWILNPNGVLFGKGAQVNVGGLVASTLDISDADFLAGKRTFSGAGGTVTNQGEINAAYVALLGEQVKNEGVIVAKLGAFALAAGNKVTLDFAGDKLLGVQVDEGALRALVKNKNLIQADGGLVVMTAKAKDALLDTAVNNTGIVRARTIENRQGKILLLGDMESGTVNVDGILDASAPGAGNGGFVETSAAHVNVADGARVATLAANGKSGTWLIDPSDYTIAASGGNISGETLSANLAGGNVVILSSSGTTGGSGDINVNDAVSWTANDLTLTAARHIVLRGVMSAGGTSTLTINTGTANGADAGVSGGSFYAGGTVAPGGRVDFGSRSGAGFLTINGVGYTVINSLGAAGSTSGADLQGMSGNLSGHYALGANIDASATSGWNATAGFLPVGDNTTSFTGTFDGLGHTINGLTINRPGANDVGLFGYADIGALIRNVGLTGGSVTGQQRVGAVAGRNGGTLDNVYNTGTVSRPSGGGNAYVGGLTGWNTSGIIQNSYNSGAVSGVGPITGGLAGENNGIIRASYNSGTVSGTFKVGGLVGRNSGTYIQWSYNTGTVIGTGSSVGGLAGYSDSLISNAYNTGAVSGPDLVGGLVGWSDVGDVQFSYNTGAVSGSTADVGGLVGSSSAGIPVTYSYWDTQTSGQATSAGGGTGVTSAQMKQQATFGSWNFSRSLAGGLFYTGWHIYEGQTTPLLQHFLTPLTVTANNASKTYDGLAYSGGNGVSYSVTPNANLLGTLSYGGTAQGAVNAGSYTLTPGGYWSNSQQGYHITYVDGTLTVDKASLAVTAGNASKTYDGLAYSGGNGVAYSGFVNGETSAVLGGALAYGGTSQGAANAGSYAIAPSGLTAANYTLNYVDGTLTVDKAPLTVTANGFTKTYEGLAYSGGNGVAYSGFVNGETSAVLGGALIYGGGSQGAVNAGHYVIAPSGLSSGNYLISFADGVMTINPVLLGITGSFAASNKFYDGTAAATIASNMLAYSGIVGADSVTVNWGASFSNPLPGNGKTVTLAGTTFGGPAGGNYSINLAGAPTATADITYRAPTVPGAPADGYPGALASTAPGNADGKAANGAPTLLTSAEAAGASNDAASALPGVPGLTIVPCGQTLPSAIANNCQ